MPFAKRAIEPTRLSRSPLEKDYKFDLDCISNNTLCGLLRQLSSLALKADSIFTEIAEECVSVARKTKRIRNRVGEITKHVDKLNAKAVTVPVGDLASFAQHGDHFQAEHGFDCYLFSPASRPEAVVQLYDKSAPSPISTIRRCNLLRSDGKTGSKFFSPALIINDEKGGEDLDTTHLSFRKPPVIKFRKPVQLLQVERETRELKEPRLLRDRPHSIAVLHELDHSLSGQSTLPTPEEKLREISRSQPVTLVPIDVTGSSFNRMCDYRTSIRSINTQYEVLEEGSNAKSLRRKRSRRQTLSGLPGFVFDEISTDYFKVGSLRTRSVSRERWERPRSMVNDSLTSTSSTPGRRARSRERRRGGRHPPAEQRDDSPVTKSCSLRRSFRSLFKGGRSRSQDLWAEGRPRSPGPPMIDLNVPLRRSRSLPRSLKSVMRDTSSFRLSGGRSASTEGRLDGWTEEELTERDIPWVRGKPPAAPARAVRAPRIPRSRSQTMTRRRTSAYHQVDSSDDSSTAPPVGPARPHSLRHSLSQGQLRAPIPVCMPTTPTSTESLTSGADSAHRMNIPAGGAAWEPFASVKLRQPKGQPDDRQSSSGNWSASSSSARQSLESDYNRLLNNSPEKRSQTSLDKDSALSLNIHSSSEDRYTTDNNGDLGEETSTLTGDTSTLNGETATEDTSTINGDVDSVIDVKASFTKMNTEDWLNSLKREKRAARRKSKHDSLDSGSGLTTQALRAHDHAHKPFVRSLSRLPDEESSVYSVDQEGFYTSMHRDSGLKRSQSEMIEEETQWQLSMDSFMSSSNSTLASSTPATKPSRAEKARRRSTSFLSNLPGLRKMKSSSKKQKKTPPPPPRRVSTVLDKSNLTLHLEHPGSPPTPSSELSKSADTSTETVINTSMQATPPPKANNGHNDSSCESDAEAIYARLKTKTSISTAGIPSLCSVTPIGSDEEDADMLSFSRSWRGQVSGPPGGTNNDTSTWTGSLVSTKSAPGSLLEGPHSMVTSTPLHSGGSTARTRFDSSSGGDSSGAVDLSISDTMMLRAESSADSSGFSTWPRSPACKTGDRHNEQKAPRPSRALHFSGPGFDPRDARNVIPEAKTPDGHPAHTRGLTTRNSFRGSNDGSERSSSKGTSSIHSPSTSSIPSSLSDDMPPVPGRFQQVSSVVRGGRGRPGEGASLSGGSGGSACTSPVNRAGHVYANVVVQNSGPMSASSSASSLSLGGSNLGLPTTSPTSLTDPNYMSVNSTWPRAAKTTPDNQADGSGKPDKKRFSTFSKPEKEVVVQEDLDEGQEEPLSVPVTSYNGPVPAPAKLIISSPVATKVSFKENPYKRSVCSPVTTQELMSFWNQSVKDKPYNSPTPPVGSALDGSDWSSREPSPSAFKPVLPAPRPATSQVVSRPLFPSLSSMKHSISFPIAAKKEDKPDKPAASTPSSYGRSWYDGISSPKKTSNSEVVPITTATSLSRPGSSIQSQISLTSFISDSPTPSLLDQRRDSISSNVSSDSGSKKHVTFATVNKASPASSQFSLKMDDGTSSLTGSVTGSIGSNESSDRKPTFSSFTKLPTVSPTNSLQRGSSQSGNLKGILSAPVPTPGPPAADGSGPSRTSMGSGQVGSSLKSPSSQGYHRPTSLALSKTVDTPSRLQSIGEGQTSEDFSATSSNPTLVGAGARKPSPVRSAPQKPTDEAIKAKTATTPLQDKPLAATTASGRDHTLPSVRPWPAKNTDTGPSKSPAKEITPSKQEARTNTASSATKQPQTARVTPTVKMPKMTSFKPVSTVAPVSKLSPEKSVKPPVHNTTDGKTDQKQTEKVTTSKGSLEAQDPTQSKQESPTKSEKESKVSPASVSKDKGSKTEDSKTSPASLSGTVGAKQNSSSSSTDTGASGKASGSQSKPPSGPTAAKVSPRIGPTRPSVLPTGTKNSPTSGTSKAKYPSGLTSSSSSLTPSTGTNGSSGTLTNSTSTLSLASSSSLLGSKLSLNKSTDSLASNGSSSSVIERNRAARLAFLNSASCQAASNMSPPSPDTNASSDPFSKYKVGGTSPGANTCTGTPPPPNSVDDRFARYKIGQRKSSTGSLTSGGSGSPTSPTCTGPSQGRFVNSVINQLATKTEGESPPSPTTPSSGLGSSIASPQSPLKTLTPPSKGLGTKTDLDIKTSLNGVKATGVVPPNINNNNNISDTQTNILSLDAKKETCC